MNLTQHLTALYVHIILEYQDVGQLLQHSLDVFYCYLVV